MGSWPQSWLGVVVMSVVTPLLFWLPVPGLAGFVGGWAGGLVVARPARAALLALLPAGLFLALTFTAGLAFVELLPLDSVLKPLFVFWAVVACVALIVGAYLGGLRSRRAREFFQAASRRPAWNDEEFWPWLGQELRDEVIDVVGEWRAEQAEGPAAPATGRATRVLDRLRYPRGASGGLVTILFTDIVGSTELTQRLGDEAAQGLLRRHDTTVRDSLAAHGGAEIKHTGDGIMASFPSAVGAVTAAVEIQDGMADGQPTQDDVRVRIGLNAGEPIVAGEDLFGTAVQLASRIANHAAPGQILVSDVVRQLVAGKSFRFTEQDPASLRGFDEPVRVFALVRADGDASGPRVQPS